LSSSPQDQDAEPKKPLQFSLRFALGVVTAFSLLCALAKWAGDMFWPIAVLILCASTFLAVNLAVLCILALLLAASQPDDEELSKYHRRIGLLFVWSIVWCVGPWILVYIVTLFITLFM